MAYLTWTNTADFANNDAPVVIDDSLLFRHQGNKDGYGFNSTLYPDSDGEIKLSWQFGKTNGASATVTFTGDNELSLSFHRCNTVTKTAYYWRPTNQIVGKTTTFDIGEKFRIAEGDANQQALFFGLMNSNDDTFSTNVIAYTNYDAISQFFIKNASGSTVISTGTVTLTCSVNYYVRMRNNGTSLTCDVYSTEELYEAGSTGDIETFSVAVSGVTGTIVCNRFGWHNFNGSGTDSRRDIIGWAEADVANLYPYHLGCKDGIWNAIQFPDAGAESKSGWTFTLQSGATSTVTLDRDDGRAELFFKQEADVNKQATFARTLKSIFINAKTTAWDYGLKFRHTFGGGALMFGVTYGTFNAGAILFDIASAGTPTLRVFDGGGTETTDAGSPGDISNDTDYWVRVKGDTEYFKADFYSTQNLYDAGAAGDVAALSVAISNVTATLLLNYGGFGNKYYETSTTFTEKWEVYWVEGSLNDWYDDQTAATGDDNTFSAVKTVFWSEFSCTSVGTILFDVHRKLTATASYTWDTNGGEHYTYAEMQARANENIYGVGLRMYLDGSTSSSTIDGITVKYTEVDSTAPGMLGGMDLAAMTGRPELDDLVLMWMQGTDAGSGFWCHILYREDSDGGNKKFLKRSVDGSNGVQYTWEDYANFDLDDCFRFFNADKGSASTSAYDCASRSFLVDAYTSGEVYKIGGVDDAENYSWTTFPVTTSWADATEVKYTVMEALQLIADSV